MSAWFLSAMPFILFAAISLIAPNYFSEATASPALIPVVITGAFLLILGNIVIYRMVHFKI